MSSPHVYDVGMMMEQSSNPLQDNFEPYQTQSSLISLIYQAWLEKRCPLHTSVAGMWKNSLKHKNFLCFSTKRDMDRIV